MIRNPGEGYRFAGVIDPLLWRAERLIPVGAGLRPAPAPRRQIHAGSMPPPTAVRRTHHDSAGLRMTRNPVHCLTSVIPNAVRDPHSLLRIPRSAL